jgi:hypothetical protein
MADRLTSPPRLDSLDQLREFIAESLAMARINAELGETHACIRDDVGLEYSVRRLVAYVRAALQSLTDLKAEKQRQQEAGR